MQQMYFRRHAPQGVQMNETYLLKNLGGKVGGGHLLEGAPSVIVGDYGIELLPC